MIITEKGIANKGSALRVHTRDRIALKELIFDRSNL